MKIKSSNFFSARKRQSGFTLIEILIVLGIIVILTSLTLASLVRSQDQQIFSNNFDRIYAMINNARSLAISGKGQLDYVDFDHDNCFAVANPPTCSAPDYVTPYNYGVHFDNTAGIAKNVTEFADMNLPASGATGQKGFYDSGTAYATGSDLDLDSLAVPNGLTLEMQDKDGVKAAGKAGSIFYSPNYADITFDNSVSSPSSYFNADPYLIIRLKSTTNTTLCKQIRIHKLAGIPEVEACSTTY